MAWYPKQLLITLLNMVMITFQSQVRERPRTVSLGRFHYQKGYDLLVEAMSHLTEDVEIDVYGTGEDLEQYEKRMKELGIKNLHFLPTTTKVFETNAKYDFLSCKF